MSVETRGLTRRSLLKRAGLLSVGAISARRVYEALETMGLTAPERAAAAVVRRREEQYLIEGLEVIVDDAVPVVIPPIYNDMITAKLTSRPTFTSSSPGAAAGRATAGSDRTGRRARPL